MKIVCKTSGELGKVLIFVFADDAVRGVAIMIKGQTGIVSGRGGDAISANSLMADRHGTYRAIGRINQHIPVALPAPGQRAVAATEQAVTGAFYNATAVFGGQSFATAQYPGNPFQ